MSMTTEFELSDALQQELARNAFNPCVGHILLSQSERARVWFIRLAPGERIGFHRHVLDYFWTALTAGVAVSHINGGPPKRCGLFRRRDPAHVVRARRVHAARPPQCRHAGPALHHGGASAERERSPSLAGGRGAARPSRRSEIAMKPFQPEGAKALFPPDIFTGQIFTDQVFLVTGAGRGIGRLLAERLASLGGHVGAVRPGAGARRGSGAAHHPRRAAARSPSPPTSPGKRTCRRPSRRCSRAGGASMSSSMPPAAMARPIASPTRRRSRNGTRCSPRMCAAASSAPRRCCRTWSPRAAGASSISPPMPAARSARCWAAPTPPPRPRSSA